MFNHHAIDRKGRSKVFGGVLFGGLSLASFGSLWALDGGWAEFGSPAAFPAEALGFLVGQWVAWGVAALFGWLAIDCLLGRRNRTIAAHALGFGIVLWAAAAMAALPHATEDSRQRAFQAGGFLGAFLTHYDALGLPFYVGGQVGAFAAILAIIGAGLLLATDAFRRRVYRAVYLACTGIEPPIEAEELRRLALPMPERNGPGYAVRPAYNEPLKGGRPHTGAAPAPSRPPRPEAPPRPALRPPSQEAPRATGPAAPSVAVAPSGMPGGPSALGAGAPTGEPSQTSVQASIPRPPLVAPSRVECSGDGSFPSLEARPAPEAHIAASAAPPTPAAPPRPPSRQLPTALLDDSEDTPIATILTVKTDERRKPVAADEEREADGVEEFAPRGWFQGYEPPPLSLLERQSTPVKLRGDEELLADAHRLEKALDDFGVNARVGEVVQGPVVTLFELKLAAGTKLNRITTLEDDLAMALAAPRVRVLAPIPGKSAVGVEIPNAERSTVALRDLIVSPAFWRDASPLLFALGVSIDGSHFLCDLARMPHLLIAGATGAGKSVTLNTLISSILFHMAPTMVRLLLIDPKRVELSIYDGVPHLAAPVVGDPDEAAEALAWMVEIMEERCRRLQAMRVRNIDKYNEIALGKRKMPRPGLQRPEYLPHMVVVIDELADLILTNRAAIETSLVRLAQKARAVGIHLVVATQRPSVDVITGLIRANFPSRIAFQVSSKTDSRIVLDTNGAECLLGRGDMLFAPGGALKPVRIQGAFISEDEIDALVENLRASCRPYYLREDFTPTIEEEEEAAAANIKDDLYYEALRAVVEQGQATQTALTSRLQIGRTNAARLIDRMEREGYVERRGRNRDVRDNARQFIEALDARDARDRRTG